MIRNTALLTLLVFTLTLFAPMFMQPKEAEADVVECAKCVIETINENKDAITMVFTGITAVAAGCIAACTVWKTWKYNKCQTEGTRGCSGDQWKCEGNTALPGCGTSVCICKKNDHDDGTSTCTNDRCNNKGTYRNCVGHTCSTDVISPSSYSGSYW